MNFAFIQGSDWSDLIISVTYETTSTELFYMRLFTWWARSAILIFFLAYLYVNIIQSQEFSFWHINTLSWFHTHQSAVVCVPCRVCGWWSWAISTLTWACCYGAAAWCGSPSRACAQPTSPCSWWLSPWPPDCCWPESLKTEVHTQLNFIHNGCLMV